MLPRNIPRKGAPKPPPFESLLHERSPPLRQGLSALTILTKGVPPLEPR